MTYATTMYNVHTYFILLFLLKKKEKWSLSSSRSSSRSSDVKPDPPCLLRNLRGPAPRHPEVQKGHPQPAPTPKPRGPCLGVPEAGPRPGHTNCSYVK